jgi:hypothetical protein
LCSTIGQLSSLFSILNPTAKASNFIIPRKKKMAKSISWATWASFSSGALSIPKTERRKCNSSTTTCASTWRMPTMNSRGNSSKKERKMTKETQPAMNGSNLTKITESFGK